MPKSISFNDYIVFKKNYITFRSTDPNDSQRIQFKLKCKY